MITEAEDLILSDPLEFSKGYPFELWRKLREEDPVHWTTGKAGQKYWSVTRHHDVRKVLAQGALYSSEENGVSLPNDLSFMDPEKSEHARLVREKAMLPVMDGPRHAKLRQPFINHFTPQAIAELENVIQNVVNGILADIVDGERFDFVRNVASWLPTSMVFTLMDIPRSDWEVLFNATNMYIAPADPAFSKGTVMETREQGARTTITYCRELGRKRRTNPGNDLLSFIASIEIDGKLLSEDEVAFLGHMFIVGGQETTRNSLSAGLYQLLTERDVIARLRAHPGLYATLPDEFIRWASPIAHLMRTATADTELGGKKINAGDWVVVWLASANRDDRAFPEPDTFDIGRKVNPHLSFGFGSHFCVGAALGRLMIRTMVRTIVEEFESLELAGQPEYVASNQFFGMKRLPVRFRRKRRNAA